MLAVRFANTMHAVRGKIRDEITTPAELAVWLSLKSVSSKDLVAFRELRDAIRDAATGSTDQIDVINRAAAAAPRWPAIVDGSILELEDSPPAQSALAAIARDAMIVLTGDKLRLCGGPGCVLLFVKEHARQEWCSPACGNRARAARHYKRYRDD